MCNAMITQWRSPLPTQLGEVEWSHQRHSRRGHKHSSSLLGPKHRSHPLPELATLAPTSPSFAGRGNGSGLFWNSVSGESAFRNALRCAVHRLVSIPSILRSQSQQLPHLRSLLHWRIEELAIPVLQDTVADAAANCSLRPGKPDGRQFALKSSS